MPRVNDIASTKTWWRDIFVKKKWYVLIVLILVAGYSLFHYIRYSPHRNPNPKYFVTIKGTVSPGLQNKIRFYMSYATSTERCEHQGFNYSYGKSKSINIKPQFNNKNEYSLVIPLDKYKPGWCNWGAASFGYYFDPEKHIPEADFSVISFYNDNISKQKSLNLYCHHVISINHIPYTQCSSKGIFNNSSLTKPTDQTYTVNISFIGEKHA